jgi:hypothetical protein
MALPYLLYGREIWTLRTDEMEARCSRLGALWSAGNEESGQTEVHGREKNWLLHVQKTISEVATRNVYIVIVQEGEIQEGQKEMFVKCTNYFVPQTIL